MQKTVSVEISSSLVVAWRKVLGRNHGCKKVSVFFWYFFYMERTWEYKIALYLISFQFEPFFLFTGKSKSNLTNVSDVFHYQRNFPVLWNDSICRYAFWWVSSFLKIFCNIFSILVCKGNDILFLLFRWDCMVKSSPFIVFFIVFIV